MDAVTLKVETRTALGKKNRALRRQGITPVHMYGMEEESLALQADELELRNALKVAGRTTPITLSLNGKDTVTIVRDIARHAVSGDIQHVDFLRVDVQQEVESPVPVVLINQDDAPGTAGGAGVVTQGAFEITVRALPFDMPNEIEVDCSVLDSLEAAILSGDLKLPSGVTLASSEEDRIAWIQPPRVSEEPTPGPTEGEEGEEGVSDDADGETDGDGETGEEE
ncbi:MAG: 50S ribosomal protein L25 [Dehalococcoidia bacterium]